VNRRDALRNFAAFLAASPLAKSQAQEDLRLPPADDVVNVFEIEETAKARLSRQLYDHISGGAGAEVTLRRNREVFDRITFRPRMLIDVREMNLKMKLLGQEMEWPAMVAPMTGQSLLHAKGEAATLEGGLSTKTIATVSTNPSGATAPWWRQVDPDPDTDRLRADLKSAAQSGCKGLLVAFGAPYEGVREHDLKNGQVPASPPRLTPRAAVSPTWEFVKQVKDASGLPVIAKGIMRPGDAVTAIEKGVQGIVVSNYGGFYSDGAPSTIEVLPSIVEAVKGRVPVLIDGGFRRGTDILKALALGANAVMLGRPVLWGLAAFGPVGVQKVLELLQTELAMAMGLSGVPTIEGINRNMVKIHRQI
jgi:4-hydroxymandelate oxidase